MPEPYRIFKEHFHAYRPEFMIIGACIFSQKCFITLLHCIENRTGNFGELTEFLFEMFVFFTLGDKIHICQTMSHFMKSDITVGRKPLNSTVEVVPGKINSAMIYMSLKRTGIITVMIIFFQDEDIFKIIKREFFKPESKLYGHGTYQNRHFRARLHFYIVEFLLLLEKISSEQKFPLLLSGKFVVIPNVFGNNPVIISFFSQKFSELTFLNQLLYTFRNRFLEYYKQKNDTQNNKNFHKVSIFPVKVKMAFRGLDGFKRIGLF